MVGVCRPTVHYSAEEKKLFTIAHCASSLGGLRVPITITQSSAGLQKNTRAVEHLELARKFSKPAGAQLGILLLGASCKPLGNLGHGQQWRPR